MILIFFAVVVTDEDIIKINKSVEEITENVIHQVLKHSEGVIESRWHEHILVMSCGGFESGFPFVSCPDANELISISKIQLGENGGFRCGFECR